MRIVLQLLTQGGEIKRESTLDNLDVEVGVEIFTLADKAIDDLYLPILMEEIND